MTSAADLEAHRGELTRLAYRLLGTVADAEDVMQEAVLRWQTAGEPDLRNVRAWLTRTCTRLCLDRIKSARHERERYVGEWLPEPLLVEADEGRQELDESLSMALLLTIQRLRPAERAAFLLHDVFGYDFREVAEILELELANCRQLAARARKHLELARPRAAADEATVRRLSDAFFAAIGSGDLERLRSVLAEDVVLHSDGGGKSPAARRPIEGAAAVARFFHRVFAAAKVPAEPRPLWFNGAPGVIVLEDGALRSAFQFQVAEGRITAIYVQRNPDKLRALASRRSTSRRGSR